ncbi:MAG: hypothetical protein ACI9UQ_001203, partial [Candidatus Krumholzibacteriia bacterium]
DGIAQNALIGANDFVIPGARIFDYWFFVVVGGHQWLLRGR